MRKHKIDFYLTFAPLTFNHYVVTEFCRNKMDETNKWDGMGFLMEPSKHLPDLPEDVIIEIGKYLCYQPDVDSTEWTWTYTYPSFYLRNFKFYYVEPRYYNKQNDVHYPGCKEVHLLLGHTSRKHRRKMRLMNIQFLKAYDIIKDRLYYRSEEYYNSSEYQDELADEHEERMRDAWKDRREDD